MSKLKKSVSRVVYFKPMSNRILSKEMGKKA